MTAKTDDACLVGPQQVLNPQSQTQIIRALNDILRTTGNGGKVLITHGIAHQKPEFAKAALEAVRNFNSFSDDNDPWAEHDFGSLLVMHQRVLWKIDYYDRAGVAHSPDPSSNKVTLRVLTIMLADEY